MRALDVLVIEDEALVALDIEGIVEERGHRVVGIAPDAARARKLAEHAPPDLVISDIQLRSAPTGDVVAAEIAKRSGARIIFVSGNIHSGDTAKLHALAPLGLLQKPYEPDALVQMLERAEEAFAFVRPVD